MKIRYCPKEKRVETAQKDIFSDFKYSRATFSGKSAISEILRYYQSIGKIPKKNGLVLVPLWMGQHVYMSIVRHALITTAAAEHKLDAIYVYHQFGFPQRMDLICEFASKLGIPIIEDCAHALHSFFDSKRLGTFGNTALFSFAKFFPCSVGGMVVTDDDELIRFCNQLALRENYQSLIDKACEQRLRFDADPDGETNLLELEQFYSIYDRIHYCPAESMQIVLRELGNKALERRAEIYQHYYACLGSVIYYYPNIRPWAIPFFLGKDEELLQKFAARLEMEGFDVGVYHFDVNRNMLDPDYKKCVLVPCHQEMTDNEVDKVIELSKGV